MSSFKQADYVNSGINLITMSAALNVIAVDVSALSPPEPMTVILTALATLTKQECLLVKHRRQPFPLYEKLQQAGFSYHCIEHNQDEISLYIFHLEVQYLFDEMLSTLNSSNKKGKK